MSADPKTIQVREKMLGNLPLFGPYARMAAEMRTSLANYTVANSPAAISAQCTAPTKTGTGTENFDLSSVVNVNKRANISFTLNGKSYTYEVNFTAAVNIAAVTAAEAAAALTAAVPATVVAFTVSTTHVKADAGDGYLGTSASLQFAAGGLVTAFGFGVVALLGGGVPSSVQLLVIGFDGRPAAGARVAVGIWDTGTGGALIPTAKVQALGLVKGAFVSGEQTNSAVIQCDGNGEADFELVDSASGADTEHMDIAPAIPDGTGSVTPPLAKVPVGRTAITKTA